MFNSPVTTILPFNSFVSMMVPVVSPPMATMPVRSVPFISTFFGAGSAARAGRATRHINPDSTTVFHTAASSS